MTPEQEAKIEHLISLMSDTIPLHPDLVHPGYGAEQLHFQTTQAAFFTLRWEIVERTSGKWLILTLLGNLTEILHRREFQLVPPRPWNQ